MLLQLPSIAFLIIANIFSFGITNTPEIITETVKTESVSALKSVSTLKLTSKSELSSASNSAPAVVQIKRDDHVATIYMDFNGFASNQLWNVGNDGTDAAGYLVQWWPDAAEVPSLIAACGCANDQTTGDTIIATAANPHQLTTANAAVQIQPIANNVLYHLKVEKLNCFGAICSPATELTFMGGDPTRVNDLRDSMTFFDDFNLPMGPADERLWNNATTPQTDPRFNLFFINPQCHTHTLTGTLNGANGDKAQVAQRPRKPIVIDSMEERRIVFDMDGIFSPRSVWYLDFNPMKTDLTGHMSFSDANGDEGLPADMLRLRSQHNKFSVHLINNQGIIQKVAEIRLNNFGTRLSTNVRRSFDVRLNAQGIKILVDSVLVMDEAFDPGAFKPGVYDLLWSCIGYNTSKDDNPYFLSHWDNFGFDGPDVEPFVVHNYKTRIDSTDYQKSNVNYAQPTFNIQVPDDIRPTQVGDTNDVFLVFTYKVADWSTHNIQPGDSVLFNGISHPLSLGINNSVPIDEDLPGYAGSIISNRIKVGEAIYGETSTVVIGNNTAQFFATNAGIMNVHLEVLCPDSSALPEYTPPAEIHYFPLHGHLPKLGTSAVFKHIDYQGFSTDEYRIIGPTVTGFAPFEFLIGNKSWAGWAPHSLRMPALTAEMWSTGSTKGVTSVNIYLQPMADSTAPGILVKSIATAQDAPAPQIRLLDSIDTRQYANGVYKLFIQAVNGSGLKSHPAYDGFAKIWNANDVSGAYYPVEITIENPTLSQYIFTGLEDNLWTNQSNWDGGLVPPLFYDGLIRVNADCEVPLGSKIFLGPNAELNIAENITLNLKG